MKKSLKKSVSILLIVAILFCTAFSMAIASAAQKDSEVVSAQAGEAIMAENTAEPVAVEEFADGQNTTEPAENNAATEETQPETQQPATIPPVTTQIEVGKVKNIVKTSFETDRITLEWDSIKGVTGYVIYYCNADETTQYTKLASINTNKCTVKNLKHSTAYYFKVAAYIETAGVTIEGAGTVKKTATQPAKPTVSLKRSSNVLEFSWTKNPKATGYIIYRACAKTNARYVAYKTIKNPNTTTFSDTNVEAGRAYYYRVKVYRNLYTDAVYNSPCGEIKFIAGMSAVNYSMTSQLSRVSLTWNKNKYAHGYDIYYATAQSGPYKLLGTTKNDYFNTVRLTNNKKYFFRVQPYKINGESKTKVVGTYTTKYKTVTDKAYGVNVGKTYIEISIKQQHMWMYINGDLYCHTDVVTGNADGYHDTPKGTYSIFQRTSPATLVGADYVSYVTYWLAFTRSGCGIHDASWRRASEYGGNTYKGNGSHGCVNTPKSAVKKIYDKARIGTYVVIY